MALPPKNTPQNMPNTQQNNRTNMPDTRLRPAGPMSANRPPMQQRPIQPNMRQAQQPIGRPGQARAVPQKGINPSQPVYTNQQKPGSSNFTATPNRNIPSKPDKSKYESNFASDFKLPLFFISTKGFIITIVIILITGFLFGSLIGGGNNTPPPQATTAMRGVVQNKDINSRMPRCGLVERGQACLLYIMNSTRYDKTAESYFDEAAKLMGVQKYSISIVNPKYAKELIKPGYFVEIKIPALH